MRLLEYEGCFAVILELFTFSCYNIIVPKEHGLYIHLCIQTSKPVEL